MEMKYKLWALADDNQEELFGICADLIKIPSVTSEQIESILEYACAFLGDANIEYDVVRAPDNTPSIIASVGKKGGKVGLFNGHLDVVAEGDLSRWDFSPYCGTVTDEQILGRGASDMKCGVGIMLFIAKKIKELNLEVQGEVRLHIVHDEEQGGMSGSKFLIENGYANDVDFCIIPEPTTFNNVEVGQKGSMRAKLTAYGRPFNSSVINYVGENAVHKLVRVFNRMKDLCKMQAQFPAGKEQLLEDSKAVIRGCFDVEGVDRAIDHVNIYLKSIDGGTSRTMTPEIAHGELDVLTPAYIKMDDVKAKINKIIEEECPKGASLPKGKGGMAIEYIRCFDGACTSIETPLVQSTLKHANHLWDGRPVVAAHQWATSDAKYYRYKNIPTIQYGPANTAGIHAYNECVQKAEIIHTAKVFWAVLDDLIGFGHF